MFPGRPVRLTRIKALETLRANCKVLDSPAVALLEHETVDAPDLARLTEFLHKRVKTGKKAATG